MADSDLEYNSEGKKNNLTTSYFQVNPGLCVKTSLPKAFKLNGLTCLHPCCHPVKTT